MTTSISPSSPSSKKKKKKKRRKSGDHGEDPEEQPRESLVGWLGDAGGEGISGGSGGGGGAALMAEAMVPFRPALEVHGWLLDLDTRCRFWSAVLESAPSPAAKTAALAVSSTSPQHDGDTLIEEEEDDETVRGGPATTSPSSPLGCSGAFPAESEMAEEEKALPRIIAAAATALDVSRRGDSGSGCGSSSIGGNSMAGEESAAGVRRRRLEKTLQQVAVHRVQQIYARLNGIADLKPAAAAAGLLGTGNEAESAVAGTDDNARLEEEARGLVAFACGSCGGGGAGGGSGSRFVRWGDEDRDGGDGGAGGGGGASWSMMMPYLPVWVGFAAREQVRRAGMLVRNTLAGTRMWVTLRCWPLGFSPSVGRLPRPPLLRTRVSYLLDLEGISLRSSFPLLVSPHR